MIIQEKIIIKDKNFIKTYSDNNCYVVRDGIEYDVAIDPAELNREYTEGGFIENQETQEELTDSEALDIILGNII